MENNDITLLSVQKIVKPKIENVIPEILKNNAKKTALDFVAYLRENKMNPAWTLHNAWKVTNKGNVLCYIRLGWGFWRSRDSENGKWEVTPYLNHISEYENNITNEGLQNIVLNNLCFCKSCGNNCSGSIDKTILGEIKNLCDGITTNRFPLPVANPDEADIGNIKRLLELEKQARIEKSKNIKEK